MSYTAPLSEFSFLLEKVIGMAPLRATERFRDAMPDVTTAVLGEAGRLCEEVLAPLQRAGDLHPARLENGVVRTSPGFVEGYRQLAQGGWVAVSAPEEFGGMGLPMMIQTAINDMMSAACLSLQLCPLMTQGQIEALAAHASDEIKDRFIPKLVSGDWAGTMNLTEPQAGSDVGALTTKAEPKGDGTYEISGQKIFISWGDSDVTENICHLVLARLPDAPKGTKGISLFLVPKRLPDAQGNAGVANRLKVVSLEHKLGLHGSPTCVMAYERATGWLIGAPHDGMAAMFTMMNNARLGVGTQGIGVADAATQAALSYAQNRRQGRAVGTGTIVEHPDVRRMLAAMRAETFAARAIALACAQAIDLSHATGSGAWTARAALLTPLAKSFGTDTGNRVAQAGIQVHGGMGVIEETGAAQFARDVRVTTIYEGTNGIQAMDLVARKMMDGGAAVNALIDEIEEGADAAKSDHPDLAGAVWQSAETLREATDWMLAHDVKDRFAGAVAYQRAFALVLGAHYHLAAARVAGHETVHAALAAVYIRRLLPEHVGLLDQARCGAEHLFDLSPEDLAAA